VLFVHQTPLGSSSLLQVSTELEEVQNPPASQACPAMFRIITGSALVETPPHPEPSLRSGSDLSPQAGRGQ
jgi:hypothetical protein